MTQGEPQVVDSRDLDCVGETGCEACDDMVALAYALERHSRLSHPLAQAIEAEAETTPGQGALPGKLSAEGLRTRSGQGLEGTVNG